jgi:hypothetical protein
MEVSRVQPNCSELVVSLNTSDRDMVLADLRKIGVEEYIVRDRYGWREESKSDWDSNANNPAILETKELTKEVQKALRDRHGDSWKSANKIIEKSGLDPNTLKVCLLDKGTTPDPNYADIWLDKDPNGTGLAIWYHQHCQPQLFHILKRISDHFNSEVESFDGGSINEYDDWLEEQS